MESWPTLRSASLRARLARPIVGRCSIRRPGPAPRGETAPRVRPAVRRRCAESPRRPRVARGSEDTRRSFPRGDPDPTGPGPRRRRPSAVLHLETRGMHRTRRRSPEGGTLMADCPECGRAIEKSNLIEGELFTCPDCGLELEVTV